MLLPSPPSGLSFQSLGFFFVFIKLVCCRKSAFFPEINGDVDTNMKALKRS